MKQHKQGIFPMPSNTSSTQTVLEALRIQCLSCILGREGRSIYNPINQLNRIVRISIKVLMILLPYDILQYSLKIVYIIAVISIYICTTLGGGE